MRYFMGKISAGMAPARGSGQQRLTLARPDDIPIMDEVARTAPMRTPPPMRVDISVAREEMIAPTFKDSGQRRALPVERARGSPWQE